MEAILGLQGFLWLSCIGICAIKGKEEKETSVGGRRVVEVVQHPSSSRPRWVSTILGLASYATVFCRNVST